MLPHRLSWVSIKLVFNKETRDGNYFHEFNFYFQERSNWENILSSYYVAKVHKGIYTNKHCYVGKVKEQTLSSNGFPVMVMVLACMSSPLG